MTAIQENEGGAADPEEGAGDGASPGGPGGRGGQGRPPGQEGEEGGYPRLSDEGVPRALRGGAARVPAQGRQVAYLSVAERPERHPGGPDGPGEDSAGRGLPLSPPREGRPRPLPRGGAPLDAAQLGEGVRALLPLHAMRPVPRQPGRAPGHPYDTHDHGPRL